MKHKFERLIIILFALPLCLGGLLYLFGRPQALSQLEKRTLQQRPAFSLARLMDGSFSRELDLYFTDQLPFREFFVRRDQILDKRVQTIFGLNDVQLINRPAPGVGAGENLGTDGKDLVTFPTRPTEASDPEPATDPAAEPLPGETGESTPEPGESSSENPGTVEAPTDTVGATSPPAPTQPPTESAAPTIPPTEPASGTTLPPAEPTAAPASPTPAPVAETEPVQTTPAPVQSNGILILGDTAMELFYTSRSNETNYAALISQVAAVLPGTKVYNLLAPSAVEFYAPSGYNSGDMSQRLAISNVYSQLRGVTAVDAYPALAAHTDAYLYFRTDHHWTGLGAYFAYTALAEQAGFSSLPLSAYEKGTVPGSFLGTLYSWSGGQKSLEANPDTVEYLYPPVSVTGYAFTDATMSAGYPIEIIKREVSANNKYLAFAEGDHGLARFESSAGNGRSILVIKESYGNAILPLLTPHYQYVYVMDPRKLVTNLPELISREGIQEVLVINYASIMGNKGWMDSLKKSLN